MSKHTPGPWEWDGNVWGYDKSNEAPWLWQSPWTANDSMQILQGTIRCRSEADARLIAAAPDLLEALQEAVGLIEMAVPFEGSTIRKARAAIAKVTNPAGTGPANKKDAHP